MPDETTSTDGGQASTSGTGQAPAPTTDGQAPVSQNQPTEEQRIIAQLRKENAAHRAEKAQREQAQLSELEKATKRTQELEATIKQRNEMLVATHVRMAAQGKGVHADLLDFVADRLAKDGFDFDDAHFAANVEKALDALIKERPALAQAAQAARQASSGGATNPGRQQAATGGQITRDFVQSMSAAQYAALSDAQRVEVQNVLRTMRGR